jgi:HEAT repeat protein
MKMALVVAVGLSLGYWVRSALSPPSACRSSHLPESTPGARIESILGEPFLGPPARHCILFLDDHEEVVREIGKRGVPYLVRALGDDEPDVRMKATLCLSVLGSDAAPAVGALRPLLRGRKDRQAYWAIICLGTIGKASAPAIPDLLLLLEHPRGCPYSQQIGEAVAQVGLDGSQLPQELSQWLSHGNPGVRQTALFALGESGELAKPLLPRVIASLNDPHLLVRVHAARSLGKLRQEQEVTLPALLRALNDPKPSVCCAAAVAIGDFGPDAAEAIPELIKLLGHPRSRVRGDAATALGKIGPKAKQAEPLLRKLLADKYPRVREAAEEALPKIRANGGESAPTPDGQQAR